MAASPPGLGCGGCCCTPGVSGAPLWFRRLQLPPVRRPFPLETASHRPLHRRRCPVRCLSASLLPPPMRSLLPSTTRRLARGRAGASTSLCAPRPPLWPPLWPPKWRLRRRPPRSAAWRPKCAPAEAALRHPPAGAPGAGSCPSLASTWPAFALRRFLRVSPPHVPLRPRASGSPPAGSRHRSPPPWSSARPLAGTRGASGRRPRTPATTTRRLSRSWPSSRPPPTPAPRQARRAPW